MLQYLHIENIAVIEQANIEFTNGFQVLTGETGAGKSIIIDALFAVLGERTSRELIRHGCDRAVVSASFCDIGVVALEKLLHMGYSILEGEDLILQRVLFADGRGQVKINGQPANVSTLKEIGQYLINIHGQHDSQTLLTPEKHIFYVDAFAQNYSQKSDYAAAFEAFRQITKEYRRISENEEEKSRRANLLSHQIEEIQTVDVKVGEVSDLKEKISLWQQSKLLRDTLFESKNTIVSENEDESAALDLLKVSLRKLESVAEAYPPLKKTAESLSGLVLDLEGVYSDLLGHEEELQFDPTVYENARLRLDSIYDLMLKYGNTEEEILAYLEKAHLEWNSITLDNEKKVELAEQIPSAEQTLIQAGAALTDTRLAAAKSISALIEKELDFLDFHGAVFKADVHTGKYTKNGCDTTEFYISANAGELPKPLAKIASGGELSRIMLAIRSVLSLKEDVGTLIFDEIDSGISGHAAQKVAVKLQNVAKDRQVICVTHLAQIAAAADRHFKIEKSVRDGKTYTAVEPLDHDGRVEEIARIMSGGVMTENVRKTAEDMISLIKE